MHPHGSTATFARPSTGFNAETITLNTHTGTHIDVPYHFFESGDTIEKLPLDAFCGGGRVHGPAVDGPMARPSKPRI